jgi:hypothetical protein
MSLAGLAVFISVLSLVVGAVSLGWQIHSSRRARRTELEVRFGQIPIGTDAEPGLGIEVVNHSDFPVRVQDVQLVYLFEPEPLIVGLSGDPPASVPGTVQPHDSGFVGTHLPSPVASESPGEVLVFANVITAVGNVQSEAFDVRAIPPLPAPMRFSRQFPDGDGHSS